MDEPRKEAPPAETKKTREDLSPEAQAMYAPEQAWDPQMLDHLFGLNQEEDLEDLREPEHL